MKEAAPRPTRYELTEDAIETIERDFSYHSPHGDQAERYPKIRNVAKNLMYLICRLTPPSREQSLAKTKLEEATFWANAAIARNEADEDEQSLKQSGVKGFVAGSAKESD